MRPKPTDNCDISPAENAARLQSIGARALMVALAREPRFLEHAQELSRISNPRRRTARLRQLARPYAPRGPDKRQLLEDLLIAVATAIEKHSAAGLTEDRVAGLSLARLDHFGAVAFYPGDGLRPGDPKRRPKAGAAHDIRETIWQGAQMIARRGAGRCLKLDCPNSARVDDYCGHCHRNPDVRRDHNRRLKAIQATWESALPHILGGPSKPRARRVARAFQGTQDRIAD